MVLRKDAVASRVSSTWRRTCTANSSNRNSVGVRAEPRLELPGGGIAEPGTTGAGHGAVAVGGGGGGAVRAGGRATLLNNMRTNIATTEPKPRPPSSSDHHGGGGAATGSCGGGGGGGAHNGIGGVGIGWP